jgi:hypothetical protein
LAFVISFDENNKNGNVVNRPPPGRLQVTCYPVFILFRSRVFFTHGTILVHFQFFIEN